MDKEELEKLYKLSCSSPNDLFLAFELAKGLNYTPEELIMLFWNNYVEKNFYKNSEISTWRHNLNIGECRIHKLTTFNHKKLSVESHVCFINYYPDNNVYSGVLQCKIEELIEGFIKHLDTLK